MVVRNPPINPITSLQSTVFLLFFLTYTTFRGRKPCSRKPGRPDPGQRARGKLINPLALIFFKAEAECEMIRQAGDHSRKWLKNDMIP
ncbi:hypothetical membrane protein [Syntrophus aciditrophicus SB]|uniref:Hypothetical membrane protein n=1 Tax=Syntrophus aciditrophicus (strain SB) TaxID=56780 RepID=Q2LYB6_SYNAS|nr:hypothetical membrane protein [Syntrophus aciditrophicus SB]